MKTMNWPEGTEITGSPAKRGTEWMCAAKFPAPEQAGIRKLYVTGEGLITPFWFASGYGERPVDAEEAAFKKYEEIVACQHDIEKIAHVDHDDDRPKAYLLDGDGTCSKCGLYIPYYFCDDRLHRAMNLATRGHEPQKRKYNGKPYIVHPRLVYNRTAFWKPYRPDEERIVMGAAAWMHDLKEDCQNPDAPPFISDQDMIDAGGQEAFDLVLWLTNPSKGVKKPRAVRKQMDREHIAAAPVAAKVIKMFDRICNLGDMTDCPENDFLKLYAHESRLLWEVTNEAAPKVGDELLKAIEAVERSAYGN